jgi:hypothetical protein
MPCFECASAYVIGQLHSEYDNRVLANLGITAAPDYEAIGKDASDRQGEGRQDKCGDARRKTSVNFG